MSKETEKSINKQTKALDLSRVVESASKCNHNTKFMSYLEWHNFAEKQTAKGIEQTQCINCGKWLFPSEW